MEVIELVIKMPEEIRLALINNIQLSQDQQSICDSCVQYAIRTGTTLPKGHGDLIDKRKFRKWIETQDGDKLMTEYYLDALDMQEAIVRGSHHGDID